MRIGFFGDGPWAHLAIEKLGEQSEFDIVYIVARYDNPDPILKMYAAKLNVPFYIFENVNEASVVKCLALHLTDVNVSMSFNQILRQDIVKMAPLGFINCHAGLLPFYRGRNVLNWALINGEKEFGVTVHYIDAGIDTGDIILQRKVEITPHDDYESVLNKAYKLCADTLVSALKLIDRGEVNVVSQSTIHPIGTYFGQRKEGDEYIDWNWSSERIYNFVRAITKPGPGARTFCGNQEYIVWKAEMISEAPEYIATVGEVVGRDSFGVFVKTGNSTIKLIQGAFINDASSSYGSQIPKLKVGTRFIGKNKFEQLLVKEDIDRLKKNLEKALSANRIFQNQ